ncbi:MAG: thiamine pyrophosphate-dependent dehydrogenase E1 component subunit alpha, partial [Candidatus Eisenbacteria bacterium]
MSAELLAVLDEAGVADPAKDPGLDTKTLLKLYDSMVMLRTLDARMMNLQRQGRIGFYGTATGEEAAALGSVAAVKDSDWIFPALRQGSALLWRGFALKAYIAQLIGNTGDVLNGHQMPCHYADRGVNVVAWSSVIATQLPHAVGMAYAARLKGKDDIAVAYFGDGATSSPDFHAAMNFAGVWKAPVVFVCHNNHWAISVPVEAQTAV